MKTTIQSISFDADKKLLEFIESKVSKLSTFYDNILDIQVYLRLEKALEGGNKVVEIKLLVPQDTLMAKQRSKTFEEATDHCIEQIKKQLKRHKELVRN